MLRKTILAFLVLAVCGCSGRASPTPEIQATAQVEITKAPTGVVEEEQTPRPEATATPTPSPEATPSLLPTAAPTSTPTPIIYVVKAGDTLGQIAAKHNVSVEAIAAANNIKDANLIQVGQKLTIPKEAATIPEPTPVSTATKKPTTEAAEPTPTEGRVALPGTPPKDWGGICQPWPGKEGRLAPSMDMDSTVELEGHLYVKSSSVKRGEMMAFTLRAIPYVTGDTGFSNACQVHVFIPIGTGPNHVCEVPSKFKIEDVVVWDKDGREIGGWHKSLDSRPVRVVGKVIRIYGTKTGLSGSNTIALSEIELLE